MCKPLHVAKHASGARTQLRLPQALCVMCCWSLLCIYTLIVTTIHPILVIRSSSDSGHSKFLLKSAGPSHHQTSVSIHQKKAFGELYPTVMVGGCELKVYRSYAHFQFFPYKFQLNENAKVLGLCWINSHDNGFGVKRNHWDTYQPELVVQAEVSSENGLFLSKCSSFQNR